MRKSSKSYGTWDADLSRTQKLIDKVSYAMFGPNAITMSIEGTKDGLLEYMDQSYGADWIVQVKGNQKVSTFTVAGRIQWDRPEWPEYRTFTIREARHTGSETELAKRMKAIAGGGLLPMYTCQCYFDRSEFKRGALVKTEDLYDSLQFGHERNSSDNDFLIKKWEDIQSDGYDIKIVDDMPFAPEATVERAKEVIRNVEASIERTKEDDIKKTLKITLDRHKQQLKRLIAVNNAIKI